MNTKNENGTAYSAAHTRNRGSRASVRRLSNVHGSSPNGSSPKSRIWMPTNSGAVTHQCESDCVACSHWKRIGAKS